MKLFSMCIEERNFHNAWAKAVREVLYNGTDLVIGGGEERKPIKDSCMLISLTGNAIKQIEDKELHPQFPFRSIDEYCKEFTREFLKEYIKNSKEQRFSYLYFERLTRYCQPVWRSMSNHYFVLLDQLSMLSMLLKNQIETCLTSNRDQAITWQMTKSFEEYPERNIVPDYKSSSPPCLQRIQIRYIPDNQVDVHLTWRSRDLFNAWQPNIIALTDMLNREVIAPNNCKIVRIIDYNDSLHVYKADIGQAKEVKLVPVSPQEMR